MSASRSWQALCSWAAVIAFRAHCVAYQAAGALLSLHPHTSDPIELVCAMVWVGLVKLAERLRALASTHRISRIATVTGTHRVDACRVAVSTRAPGVL